jgi:hypothetical protein
MDRFVRVEVRCGHAVLRRFNGELRSSRPLLVDAVRLIDLDDHRCISAIQNYPHCVEPTLVLLRRFLDEPDCRNTFSTDFSTDASLSVTISRDEAGLFATTLLQVNRAVEQLSYRLVSEPTFGEASVPLLSKIGVTVARAIALSLDSASGWAACPPLPMALCTIPIRRRVGQKAYVQMQDIPEFARSRLCKRMGISSASEEIDAEAWSQYLRSLRHERQCELLNAQMGSPVFKHPVSF